MFPKPTLLIASVVFIAIDFVKNQNALMRFNSLTAKSISQPLIASINTNKLTDTSSPEKISYIIINANSDTYGYDIYINNKRYIHQLTIPGMPGNNGFQNKPDAEKIAKLVIDQVQKKRDTPNHY